MTATSRSSDQVLLVDLWELDVATFEISDVKTLEEMGRVYSSVLFRKSSFPLTPNSCLVDRITRECVHRVVMVMLPLGRDPAIFTVFSAVSVAAKYTVEGTDDRKFVPTFPLFPYSPSKYHLHIYFRKFIIFSLSIILM